jgi:hypothetical protein
MASLKVIQGSERAARVQSQLPETFENENQTGAKVGRAPSAAPLAEEKKMSTRTDAVSPWHLATLPTKLVTTSTRAHRPLAGRQEVWAGAVYLMIWSLLWLAVIVTVLAPLDELFGGVR